MRNYPRYKESGVEWIGQVPVEWNVRKIKWLTSVKRGASPRPIDDPKYFDDAGEFAWVRIADVTASERYLIETTQKLSGLGASLSVKRYPGDFFLSIAGSVGKPMITRIKCCIHDGFVWFPELKINPEFLYYIFQTGLPYQGLGKLGTQLNLNTDSVGGIGIPVPCEKEIAEIVKYLDRKTSEIDNLISKKQKLIDLLEEERTALINQAVTKGIDPNVKMKPSGVEWLGDVPAHWEVKRMKHIVKDLLSGVSVNSIDIPADSNEIAVLKTSCVYNFKFDASQNKCVVEDETDKVKCPVTKGSIVISRMNTPDLVGASGFVENDAPNLFLPDRLWKTEFYEDVLINARWLSFILISDLYRKALSSRATGTSSSMKNISKEDFLTLPVPVPTFKEQSELVKFFVDNYNRIDNIIEKTSQEIGLLNEYKTALISEVVTGKIDIRSEVPATSIEMAGV